MNYAFGLHCSKTAHFAFFFKRGDDRKKKIYIIICQNQLIRDSDNSRHEGHLNSQGGYVLSDTYIIVFILEKLLLA